MVRWIAYRSTTHQAERLVNVRPPPLFYVLAPTHSGAAGLLSFTFSFDDYVVPAFVNGTTNTWPIVLYSAVRFGITPAVNALATIMLVLTALAVVATAIVLRRSRARTTVGADANRGGLGALIGL